MSSRAPDSAQRSCLQAGDFELWCRQGGDSSDQIREHLGQCPACRTALAGWAAQQGLNDRLSEITIDPSPTTLTATTAGLPETSNEEISITPHEYPGTVDAQVHSGSESAATNQPTPSLDSTVTAGRTDVTATSDSTVLAASTSEPPPTSPSTVPDETADTRSPTETQPTVEQANAPGAIPERQILTDATAPTVQEALDDASSAGTRLPDLPPKSADAVLSEPLDDTQEPSSGITLSGPDDQGQSVVAPPTEVDESMACDPGETQRTPLTGPTQTLNLQPATAEPVVPTQVALDEVLEGGGPRDWAAHQRLSSRSDVELPSIPGFEVQRKLGAGGMGDVYLARDLELGAMVAIKVARSNRHDTQEQFLQEARTLAKVKHRNIVPVLRLDKFGDEAYFAMEYIEGPNAAWLVKEFRHHEAHKRNLDDILRIAGIERVTLSRHMQRGLEKQSQVYYRLVASWIAGAAEGLRQAQKKKVLHRDIKPGNLLLAQDGEMMVADFGLARQADDRSSSQTGGVTGTYPYTPPEKVVGDWGAVDHRADIWALGATLYEFLAYRRAYPRSGKDVLTDIATTDPPAPRQFVKGIPQRLQDICLKAMRRNPDDRYQSAAEMADDLYAWLGKKPPARWPMVLASCLATALVVSVILIAQMTPEARARYAPTAKVAGLLGMEVGPQKERTPQTTKTVTPDPATTPEAEPAVAKWANIRLVRNSIQLHAGGVEMLQVEGRKGSSQQYSRLDTDLGFVSFNEDVASVDGKGLVTAVAPGETRIQVAFGDLRTHCAVRVSVPSTVTPPTRSPASVPKVLQDVDTRSDDVVQAPAAPEIPTVFVEVFELLGNAEDIGAAERAQERLVEKLSTPHQTECTLKVTSNGHSPGADYIIYGSVEVNLTARDDGFHDCHVEVVLELHKRNAADEYVKVGVPFREAHEEPIQKRRSNINDIVLRKTKEAADTLCTRLDEDWSEQE